MKILIPCLFVVLSVLTIGCQDPPAPPTITPEEIEAEIAKALARLGPEEQRIAEQQKFCPMMEGARLGEMGQPYKVTIRGVSAYVCCENCARAAQDDPDKALAQIERLKQASTKAPAPAVP